MAIIAAAETSPMGEINMPPLIDVMLVLLVMFIITIPLQTHAVKLDLPKDCPNCPVIDRLKNKLVITNSGAILWNGNGVSMHQLRYLIEGSARKNPEPELHFQPEPEARFELVDEVLAMTKRAGVRRNGLCRQRGVPQLLECYFVATGLNIPRPGDTSRAWPSAPSSAPPHSSIRRSVMTARSRASPAASTGSRPPS
jgi:biopolymer transport protein ExbD